MPKPEEEFARRARLLKRVGEQIKTAEAKGRKATLSGEKIARERGGIRFRELESKRIEKNLRKIAQRKEIKTEDARKFLKRVGESLRVRKRSRRAIAKELGELRKARRGFLTQPKEGLRMGKALKIGKRIGDLIRRQKVLKLTFPKLLLKGGAVVPTELLKKRFEKERPGA